VSIFLVNQSNSKSYSSELLQNQVIGIIGLGTMGSAILRALSKKNIGKKILIFDHSKEKEVNLIKSLKNKTICSSNLLELQKKASIIIIAIKPKDFFESNLKFSSKVTLLSIMAGVRIHKIQKISNAKKVIRVMPNLCAIINESYSAFSSSKEVNQKDKSKVTQLLNCFGTSVEVKENKLDSITALSGSGVAFVAYLMNSFTMAAKNEGLNEKESNLMIAQVFYGASKLIFEQKFNTNDLIKKVSSKKGTTLAGLSVLAKSSINSIIKKTIKKASKRSKKLAEGKA
jgi:pyrroline-5-carboxylate reductase